MVAEESQDLEMVHGSRAEEGAANGTGPTMVEHGLVSTQCPPPPATPEGDGLPAEATGGGNGEDAAAGNRTQAAGEGAGSGDCTPADCDSSSSDSNETEAEDGGDEGGLSFDIACGMVNSMKKIVRPKPVIKNSAPGEAKTSCLPAKELTMRTQAVSHVFEVFEADGCPLVSPEHAEAFEKHEYHALPAPLSPAANLEFAYKMDVITVRNEATGKVTVFKNFCCEGGKISARLAGSLCRSKPLVLQRNGQKPVVSTKAIEFLKDKMGRAVSPR